MDEQRAEFEAWASYFFTKGELDRHGINGARPGEYRVLHIERMWAVWQAATQRQQERIAYVEKIAEDAIELCTQQANRVMELEAQVQALSLDAARYQFLRAGGAYLEPNSEEIYMATDDGGKYYHDRRDLDMDIDAAIARATHKEGA